MKDGLLKPQRRILTQALTPSPAAIKRNSAHMDFIPADAWPDHQPSVSERASLSRTLRRLETRGLLASWNGSSQATNGSAGSSPITVGAWPKPCRQHRQ